ncbi:hypothetical protein SAMN05720766_1158 [Fibrobacter sp. UWH9]|uniref:type II toxin-antitoxin system VapC family toxin n=1 Tax=unclassified Fibrobacter TaxID=2634177 RepID=UPI00091BB862|nr:MULTISPECIES: hypothetical protein [unclassified Fibrobacter]OWV14884.1 hypothetical protein B7992_07160 [Fibrobacter sp. UWH1]SHH55596.1 hypothetical protein SAMN05720766_1158 [Fibrobacter sp. UWH9]
MTERETKIYLDNCCYNRPYDNQSQIRVALESQAKLHVQSQIKEGNLSLVTSFVLEFENLKNPHLDRQCSIADFFKYSKEYIDIGKRTLIEHAAAEIVATGVKFMDACHVACAELAKCDYFLTTDKRLLKYKSSTMKLVNPIDFLFELEGNYNGN